MKAERPKKHFLSNENRKMLCSECFHLPDGDQLVCGTCAGRLGKKRVRASRKDEAYTRYVCNLKYRSAERAKVLSRMGFNSYSQYLQSDLWKKIRQKVRRYDQGKCRICKKAGSDVHHRDYDEATMRGESIRSLVLLCRDCHRVVSALRTKMIKRKKKWRGSPKNDWQL